MVLGVKREGSGISRSRPSPAGLMPRRSVAGPGVAKRPWSVHAGAWQRRGARAAARRKQEDDRDRGRGSHRCAESIVANLQRVAACSEYLASVFSRLKRVGFAHEDG